MDIGIVQQHVDLAREDDGVVDAPGAMHAGVARRLAAGIGCCFAIMARDLGEEIRIEVVRFRGRMKLDDTENRAVGRRRNADLARGGIGLAGDVGGRRVRDPEVEHLDAQFGLAAGLGRNIVVPDDRLTARVMDRDHAPNIVRCRHPCFPPVVVTMDVTPDRARSRWRARGTYHGRSTFRQAPRNRGRKRTSHASARGLSAPIAVACAARTWQGRLAKKARERKLGAETVASKVGSIAPNKNRKQTPRKTPKAQMLTSGTVHAGVESPFAWGRLAAAVVLGAVGSVGMWSVPVVLPAVQAVFGVARADASLPFTLAMVGFAFGGVAVGRLSDRLGIVAPVVCGEIALSVGYIGAGFAPNLVSFALLHIVIGIGASATFGPLIADTSQWFTRRRGIAVAIVACGNYLGGTIWPPILHPFVASEGWLAAHVGVGVFCGLATLPLLLALRRRAPMQDTESMGALSAGAQRGLGISPTALQAVLCIAGLSCCVAMAMPQVHIVAYCGDLGYGVARGAEMLSLMMAFGVISRIGSGFLADKIGGIRTLLIGSVAQGFALLFYLFFDGLTSLYIISAMFGLFQGGIVPSYAIIVRESMPASEAATRVGIVIFASVFGMSFGGWISGVIFDATGSYAAAFANGLGWNALNITIMVALLLRARARLALA